MGLTQIEGMGQYAKMLRQSTGEAVALSDDLLIHVTGFFRDPEVWAALAERVIAPLVAEREDGGPSGRGWPRARPGRRRTRWPSS